MSDTSRLETGRAAREARDSVASRPTSASSAAVAAAMRRYLGAEQYRELKAEEGQAAGEQDAAKAMPDRN
jgi:hypothetical protein